MIDSNDKEIILNGGADKINGQDDGEWKEMKKQDEEEVAHTDPSYNEPDAAVELPEGIY